MDGVYSRYILQVIARVLKLVFLIYLRCLILAESHPGELVFVLIRCYKPKIYSFINSFISSFFLTLGMFHLLLLTPVI